MPHHDEKGQISPAQSKVAQQMRKPLVPMREEHRHLLGKTMGGMAREQEQAHGGYPIKTVSESERRGTSKATRQAWHFHRKRLETIARGKKSEYRKSYTKHGAKMHKKGLLHAPKEA